MNLGECVAQIIQLLGQEHSSTLLRSYVPLGLNLGSSSQSIFVNFLSILD